MNGKKTVATEFETEELLDAIWVAVDSFDENSIYRRKAFEELERLTEWIELARDQPAANFPPAWRRERLIGEILDRVQELRELLTHYLTNHTDPDSVFGRVAMSAFETAIVWALFGVKGIYCDD